VFVGVVCRVCLWCGVFVVCLWCGVVCVGDIVCDDDRIGTWPSNNQIIAAIKPPIHSPRPPARSTAVEQRSLTAPCIWRQSAIHQAHCALHTLAMGLVAAAAAAAVAAALVIATVQIITVAAAAAAAAAAATTVGHFHLPQGRGSDVAAQPVQRFAAERHHAVARSHVPQVPQGLLLHDQGAQPLVGALLKHLPTLCCQGAQEGEGRGITTHVQLWGGCEVGGEVGMRG